MDTGDWNDVTFFMVPFPFSFRPGTLDRKTFVSAPTPAPDIHTIPYTLRKDRLPYAYGVAMSGRMPRYALKIEYDGGPFSGWQKQDGVPTVQGAIHEALAKLEADVSGVSAAGRTDAGVHAIGQVAHCDLTREWKPFRLAEALNHHLKPLPVAIVDAVSVTDGFHARFSALERRYHYRIVCRRAPLALDQGLAWRVPRRLDTQAMRSAARHLVGRHDFTTFRASECQARSPVKTVDALEITAAGDGILVSVRARSFLHSQVRSFVGTLERVGAGAWPAERVSDALKARSRAACGPLAPPDGLYLTDIRYDPDPFIR